MSQKDRVSVVLSRRIRCGQVGSHERIEESGPVYLYIQLGWLSLQLSTCLGG